MSSYIYTFENESAESGYESGQGEGVPPHIPYTIQRTQGLMCYSFSASKQVKTQEILNCAFDEWTPNTEDSNAGTSSRIESRIGKERKLRPGQSVQYLNNMSRGHHFRLISGEFSSNSLKFQPQDKKNVGNFELSLKLRNGNGIHMNTPWPLLPY